MIVKCDQCSTKFKLDDTKIRNEGVKVRCSKCKHIFEVKKEASQDEPDFDTILSGLDSAPQPPAAPSAEDALPKEPAPNGGIDGSIAPPGPRAAEVPHDEFSFDDSPFAAGSVPEEPPPAAESDGLDFGDFSFGETSGVDATTVAAPAPISEATASTADEEFSLGEFTFGDDPAGSTSHDTSVAASVPPGDSSGGETDFDFGDFAFSEEPATTTENSSADNAGSFDQDATVFMGTKKPADESTSSDFGDFSFDEPGPPSTTVAESASESAPDDFGDFSFDEPEPSSPTVPGTVEETASPDFGDFSFDEAEPASTAVSGNAGEMASGFEATVRLDINPARSDEGVDEPLPDFDFGTTPDEAPVPLSTSVPNDDFSFEDSFGATPDSSDGFSFGEVNPSNSVTGPGASIEPLLVPPDDLPMAQSAAPEPDSFDFGNFDFGDTSATDSSAAPSPPERRPAPAFVPTAVAPEPSIAVEPSAPEDEVPPLPIASRRKESQSTSYAVLGIACLVIIAICGGGYYLYDKGTAAFESLGLGGFAKSLGIESPEEGAIALKNPAPAFISNQEAGELFVVTGEAVNNFKKPRASIQIKATLYGPKGEVLLQKTAYCGNVLTKEQLAVMPYPKIEAAMSNQFGDSLANMGVKPGKSIPFVVVLSQVPKAVGEYGIEVVSSTVASQ